MDDVDVLDWLFNGAGGMMKKPLMERMAEILTDEGWFVCRTRAELRELALIEDVGLVDAEDRP